MQVFLPSYDYSTCCEMMFLRQVHWESIKQTLLTVFFVQHVGIVDLGPLIFVYPTICAYAQMIALTVFYKLPLEH